VSERCNNWWCSKDREHGGSCGTDPIKQAWSPERRERVGRAAYVAHVAWVDGCGDTIWRPVLWEALSECRREGFRQQGEAAARADEDGR